MIQDNSISNLFEQKGISTSVGGNNPFLLDNPDSVWLVRSGRIDIFSVRLEDGKVVGARSHFFSVQPGELLFGVGWDLRKMGRGLLAVGITGTELQKTSFKTIKKATQSLSFCNHLAPFLDTWISGLSSGISKGLDPRTDLLPKAGSPISVKAHERFRPLKGVLWIRGTLGDLLFLGMEDIALTASDIFPVSHEVWMESFSTLDVEMVETFAALPLPGVWEGLDHFYRVLLKCEALNKRLWEVDEYNRLKERAEASQEAAGQALQSLGAVLQAGFQTHKLEIQNNWFKACQMVAESQQIQLRPPPEMVKHESLRDPLAAIARTSRIRIRKVALKDEWWVKETGSLLGLDRATDAPLAVIQTDGCQANVYNPADGSRRLLTRETAESLSPTGYVFYRSFSDEVVSAKNLIRFGAAGLAKEWIFLVLMGVAGGLAGMMIPMATAWAFDSVVPESNGIQLFHLSIGLLLAALAASVFHFLRNISFLRIEGRMDQTLQSAVIDRLLKLPAAFFRSYNSGDLAQRAVAINQIRQIASQTVAQAVLINTFAVFNLVLLFVYNARLAMISIALLLVVVVFSLRNSLLQVRFQRRIVEQQGKISGMVLQFLAGISKLRVAGAELFAFSAWARKFSAQKNFYFHARQTSNHLLVFNSMLPIIATALLFGFTVFWSDTTEVKPGEFLAFFSAFTLFTSALLSMTSTLVPALSIVPLYERLQPILRAKPEVDAAKLDPGALRGSIDLTRVSFRYNKNGPMVLDNLSLQIFPGEFVAIVGPSGSGKSTLLRLLLGFEHPETGSIQYDGQDLAGLEIGAVRRQLGVVLQNGKLSPGDILSNIIGSLPLTGEDAWAAARMVGLDEDIEKMPMGMHTMISAGMGLFSGGQQQRLMIARAIVFKPRILLFDEATSALDNRTQSLVSQSLEKLQATRVVIAHRLSTIINADRIIVMEAGRMVQSGNYPELFEQTGLFREMAQRQLMENSGKTWKEPAPVGK